MTALVLGATGLTGGELVRQLCEDPKFRIVKILTRRPLDLSHPKLQQIQFTKLEELSGLHIKAALNCDVCFFTFGSTRKKAGSKKNFRDIEVSAIQNLLKALESVHVKSLILVSATGADPSSLFFYNKVKGEVETLATTSKISRVVIFRPAMLLGKRQEARPIESTFVHALLALERLIGRKSIARFATNTRTLAKRMIETSKSENQTPERLVIPAHLI